MKIIDEEVLLYLNQQGYDGQIAMRQALDISIGSVNQALRNLIEEKYLDTSYNLTNKAHKLIADYKPKQAIILAAGFGLRMIPLNYEIPKGLLKVNDEVLIERIIRQLQAVGVSDIKVVVGFQKEKFEYLIDKFNVELIVNMQYARRNNYYSLLMAKEYISNVYVCPSDIYFYKNPFRQNEISSWYLMDKKTVRSTYARVNRKLQIIKNNFFDFGNHMLSTMYLCDGQALEVLKRLEEFDGDHRFDGAFFEDALFEKNQCIIPAKLCMDYIEINTFEDYRRYDEKMDDFDSNALKVIKDSLKVDIRDIKKVRALKKGMTNNSFLFEVNNKRYVMRIPGSGTDRLINRYQEADVFKAIGGYAFSENIIYINPDNGYKITEFIENSRNCDAFNKRDVKMAMKALKEFHNLKLKVNHQFNLFEKIMEYEALWNDNPSIYQDYIETRDHVLELQSFIDGLDKAYTLCHIDAVCDNFLFQNNKVYLIDWEYAAMQDPHVDIAMFAIYAMYDLKQVDRLIDIYFDNHCDELTRTKIYAYIAVAGLVWSNWCEFKYQQGIEFGEYSLKQYRYAKDYYRLVKRRLNHD